MTLLQSRQSDLPFGATFWPNLNTATRHYKNNLEFFIFVGLIKLRFEQRYIWTQLKL